MPISIGRAAEEILLWIYKGRVVTVWSSVLWTDRLDLYLKDQSDRSARDNRVGVGGWDIVEDAGGESRRKNRGLRNVSLIIRRLSSPRAVVCPNY
jgi:hypothetical protein